jgi:hypothetical protein
MVNIQVLVSYKYSTDRKKYFRAFTINIFDPF